MDTRMSKYDTQSNDVPVKSRVQRNSSLYNEINNQEIDNFKLRSNAEVIGKQEREIDVEQIKKILDTRYKDAPKRRSIRIESTEEPVEEEVQTKEYDLNVILDKAKEEKQESYEEVRSKKLRDTQFDILKNLNIEDYTEEKHEARPEDNDLLNLINTITINEEKKHATGEVQDLLSLTSEKKEEKEEKIESLDEDEDEDKDNAEDDVASIMAEQESTMEEQTNDIKVNNSIEEIKNEIKKVENTSKILKDNQIDNSFYTSSTIFKKKDFKTTDEDDDDKLGIGLKILIVIVVIAILIGMFFFIKTIINS